MEKTLIFLAVMLVPLVAFADVEGPPLVLDGDTIEVEGRVINLVGIDAPEFGQRCRRGGTIVDCGMMARTQLLDLTGPASVACVIDESRSPLGWPAIAQCRAGGYDLSEGMSHTGWALPTDDASARYRAVAADARHSGRGLWGFDFISPADWRSGTRLIQD
jgi:endonuclease YncB( thermonuclease family)